MNGDSPLRCFPGQCLDFVQTVHMDRIAPFLFCHMEYEGRVDPDRLLTAVRNTGCSVPELFCTYNPRRGRFEDIGLTADDVIVRNTGPAGQSRGWDFTRTTQLKALLGDGSLIVGASHVLCDGQGLLQYLYLLAGAYNRATSDRAPHNHRSTAPLLKGIRVGRATPLERTGRGCGALWPHCEDNGDGACFCLSAKLGAADTNAVSRRARRCGATFNDVLLTAYARALAALLHTESVVLPCPADLRRFSHTGPLTVANMTGVYTVCIPVLPAHSFGDTLSRVRREMLLQKERRRCFAGIRPLRLIYRKLPAPAAGRIVRRLYAIPPLSYTNLGVIDSKRLAFNGAAISNCFLTGAYRPPPGFQLTVGTFREQCTLSCALRGGEKRRAQGQQLLDLVRRELLSWALPSADGQGRFAGWKHRDAGTGSP